MMAIWKILYNYFRRTDVIDNWIIAFNMILLFTVLFYIFPIRSLITAGSGSVRITVDNFSDIFQMYSLGFMLIFLCFCLMYYRAFKKTDSLKLLFYSRHFLIFVIIGFLSILLAIFRVGLYYGVPGFIYVLLGPICYFHSVKFHKKRGLEF